MKLTDLKDFFEGKLAFIDFKSRIKNEVMLYKQNLQKKGSSVPIYLIEDTDFELDSVGIMKLCNLYVDMEMLDYELSYIADALLLSTKVIFKNNEIEEILESLTDPETNGQITIERINEILDIIDKTRNSLRL